MFRVVEGSGRTLNVATSRESYQSIAEVLPLKKNKHHEDEHDTCRGKGEYQRRHKRH